MNIGCSFLAAFYLFSVGCDIFEMNAFRTGNVVNGGSGDSVERAVLDKDIPCLDFAFGTVNMQKIIAFLAGDVFQMYVVEIGRIRSVFHVPVVEFYA